MKAIFRICLLLIFAGLSTGCAVNFNNVGVATDGTPYANNLTDEQKESIEGLKHEIISLDPKVDHSEAAEVAYNAVVYPMHLSNEYDLVWPPSLQNIFVNSGVRQRGLCYQWAQDMLKFMRAKNYQTLEFSWVIADRATRDEHNSATVMAKGHSWDDGIVLDPWRNSGSLFWGKVKNDPKYKWHLYTPRKK